MSPIALAALTAVASATGSLDLSGVPPMSPLAVEMLIWACTRSGGLRDFPNVDREPQREVIALFHADGVVDRSDYLAGATEKGRAWMALICATPVPVLVERYMDPRTKDLIDA